MKKTISLLIVLLPLTLLAQTKTALFLGNSYSYSNGGIPSMLAEIASSLEDTLIFDENLMGGARLEDHTQNTNSLSKISAQPWDYVVLQEQSQMPSFPQSQVESMVYPFAEILCDSIYANDSCTMPMFFMTWGRENGDASNCESWPPVCTYEGMQLELRKSYLKMTEDNGGYAAPVGMVWKAIREDFPDIDLYSSDGSHPSLAGTFLASNVFYTAMFHSSPVGGYIPDGISAADALHMQEYAANIVFDSLDVWMIDTTHVTAFFMPDIPIGKSLTGYFFNDSENAEWFAWDFGDGSEIFIQTEYVDHAEHVFPAEGEYTVCLTAWKDCDFDVYCDLIHTDFFQSDALHDAGDKIAVYGEPLKDSYQLSSGFSEFYNTGKKAVGYSIYCDMGQAIPKSENEDWFSNKPIEGLRLKLHAVAVMESAFGSLKSLGFVTVTKGTDDLIIFKPLGDFVDGKWDGDTFNSWSNESTDIKVFNERYGRKGYAEFDLLSGNGFFYKGQERKEPDYFLSNCERTPVENLPVYDWKY